MKNFFDQIKKPAEFEAEVVEQRNTLTGVKFSKEHKRKLAEASIGRKQSAEHIAKRKPPDDT